MYVVFAPHTKQLEIATPRQLQSLFNPHHRCTISFRLYSYTPLIPSRLFIILSDMETRSRECGIRSVASRHTHATPPYCYCYYIAFEGNSSFDSLQCLLLFFSNFFVGRYCSFVRYDKASAPGLVIYKHSLFDWNVLCCGSHNSSISKGHTKLTYLFSSETM